MNNLEFNEVQQHWDKFISSAIAWAPRIITAALSALLIYLVGSWSGVIHRNNLTA